MPSGPEANRVKAVQRAEKVAELRSKGLTYDEVGERLNLSAETVRQIVSRHRRRNQDKPAERRFYPRRNDDQS